MKILNLFKRNTEKEKEVAELVDPDEMPEPKDIETYMRRGWAYHSRDLESKAEADFRRALDLDPESVDANFVLGLVLKAKGEVEEAVQQFDKTVRLLEAGKLDNKARTEMLRRLSLGHINELKSGDWDLEKEVWRRKS
jgi:tetratricopeptide (TPR) repeat protein